jgi:hypothetical protein
LSGIAHAVFIDENGKLGTVTPGVLGGSGTVVLGQQQAGLQRQVQNQQDLIRQLQGQVQEQQPTNAELRTRLARVEALLQQVSVSRRQ